MIKGSIISTVAVFEIHMLSAAQTNMKMMQFHDNIRNQVINTFGRVA